MNKLDFKKMKENTEHVVDPHNKGCLHTLTFKVLCGFAALLVIGMLYNWIVSDSDREDSEQKREEEAARDAQLDTLDVVGDYLWKEPAVRPEDVLPEKQKKEDQELKEKVRKEVEEEARKAKEDAMKAEAEAAAPDAPAPGSNAAPTVEKIEAPQAAPIE